MYDLREICDILCYTGFSTVVVFLTIIFIIMLSTETITPIIDINGTY